MARKLEKIAEQALMIADIRSGSGSTASEAVKIASKGAGLNDEEISRVCTLVNRKLHSMEKRSHGAGNLWKSRWNTAKPEEVLGRTPNTTRSEPNSSSEKVAHSTKESSSPFTKISSLKVLQPQVPDEIEDEYVFNTPEELSTKYENVEKFQKKAEAEARSLLEDLRKTYEYGQVQVERQELELLDKEQTLVQEALRVKKAEDLSFAEVGEVLTKHLNGYARLPQVMDVFVKSAGIDLEDINGSTRDEWGDLIDHKVAKRQALLSTREGWGNVLEKTSSISAFSRLIDGAKEVLEQDQTVRFTKEAAQHCYEDWAVAVKAFYGE